MWFDRLPLFDWIFETASADCMVLGRGGACICEPWSGGSQALYDGSCLEVWHRQGGGDEVLRVQGLSSQTKA